MNLNKWIRQGHRWMSVVFTVTVVVTFVVLASAKGEQPPAWVIYSSLPPLLLLLLTGLYLFVLPYAAKWRRARRSGA